MQERIAKTLSDVCRKAAKNQMCSEGHLSTNAEHYMKIKEATASVVKKREALTSFC
jgi:hypothetical protein